MKPPFDPRPAVYSAAALAVAACLCALLLSWRQTPDQRKYVTYAAANTATAAWRLAEASGHLEAAIAPLADAKTGISPAMRELVAAVSNTAQNVSTADVTGLVRRAAALIDKGSTLAETLDGQAAAIGAAAVKPLASADALLAHTDQAVAAVDETLPLFTDCEFNPDCAFNRFQGVSKAVEQMAQAGAEAAPKLAESAVGIGKSADGIASDVRREADEFTRPKKWWQKITEPAYTVLRLAAAFL